MRLFDFVNRERATKALVKRLPLLASTVKSSWLKIWKAGHNTNFEIGGSLSQAYVSLFKQLPKECSSQRQAPSASTFPTVRVGRWMSSNLQKLSKYVHAITNGETKDDSRCGSQESGAATNLSYN